MVISERARDGHERDAGTWFRRASRKAPERGGARKSTRMQGRDWPERIRAEWAAECNRALEQAGRAERIDPRSLAEQAREALEKGDLERAAELSREPEPKRGAGDGIQRRWEEGRAAEPSRAVASWERVRRANAEWAGECRERAREEGEARAGAELAGKALERAEDELELGELEQAVDVYDEAQLENRWGGLNEAIGRGAELQRALRGGGGPDRGRGAAGEAWRRPTLWERYEARWPQHAQADKRLFAEITRQLEHWRRELTGRFRKLWGGRAAEPKPLPAELAPAGRAEAGAARSEPEYAEALPTRYRERWDGRRMGARVREARQAAERSWRYRRAGSSRKPGVLEDAVRRACGAEAQDLDRAMRIDREEHRPRWDVLKRHDTLRSEEREAQRRERERQDRIAGAEAWRKRLDREGRGRDGSGRDRGGGWER